VSPKTKLLVLTFAFDTNDVMLGRWTVELISGDAHKIERRTINTVAQVAGVDIGNRMEMYVENSFGGDSDVSVHINGTIVGMPQVLSAGTRSYEVRSWSEPRDFTADISRANFDKTHTIRVVQPTEAVNFTIQRTVQNTQAETKISGSSGNIEVGVENSVEAAGTVGIAEGKDTVKLSAKGSYGLMSQVQNTGTIAGGFAETVAFTGRKVSAPAPTITPLL